MFSWTTKPRASYAACIIFSRCCYADSVDVGISFRNEEFPTMGDGSHQCESSILEFGCRMPWSPNARLRSYLSMHLSIVHCLAQVAVLKGSFPPACLQDLYPTLVRNCSRELKSYACETSNGSPSNLEQDLLGCIGQRSASLSRSCHDSWARAIEHLRAIAREHLLRKAGHNETDWIGMPTGKGRQCEELMDIWKPHGCVGPCVDGVDDLNRVRSTRQYCAKSNRGLYTLESGDLMICCHAKQVKAFKEWLGNAGKLQHISSPFRFWVHRKIWKPLSRACRIVFVFVALVVGLIWPMGDAFWRHLPSSESFGRKMVGPHARDSKLLYESELAPLKRSEALHLYSPDISSA